MLEMIDIGVQNAVAYRLEGKITEEEMKSVFSIFRKKVEKGEKLLVYQEVVSIFVCFLLLWRYACRLHTFLWHQDRAKTDFVFLSPSDLYEEPVLYIFYFEFY